MNDDDDKTIIKGKMSDSDDTVFFQADKICVELINAQGETIESFSFSNNFTIGRALTNDIVVKNETISRQYLKINRENGEWWLYNLKNTNSVYIHQQKINDKEKLNFPVLITLGSSGIQLKIQQITPIQKELIIESPKINSDKPVTQLHRDLSPEQLKSRLLGKEEIEDAGEFTTFMRKVIKEDRMKRGKNYKKIIWILAGLFFCAVGLATYQHFMLENTRKLAIDMFYDIKTLEVSLLQADMKVEESYQALETGLKVIRTNEEWLKKARQEKLATEQLKEREALLAAEKQRVQQEQENIAKQRKRMLQERDKLASMKDKYRQYVEQTNSLRIRFPTDNQYEEDLIAKVARELGESELELPDGFVMEVKKYIHYWQTTSRMKSAVNTALENNYFPIIISELKKQGLPLQFLYLPLQESNYNTKIVGPATRYGIAKGAWQFIPETGRRYGLSIGPLVGVREYDALDDRFNFKLASAAGAKYLKTIYSTKAQASGLLVIASYNWGEGNIIRKLGRMPDNPRDKNFWKFTQQFDMPEETYGYVYYIFAAAVIGEDPQHFGFNFKSPLANVKETAN